MTTIQAVTSHRWRVGGAEVDDVEAVVRLARKETHAKVVTVGTSMGGIAVLRHAGLIGGVDEVVAISSLAGMIFERLTPP
jgi:alpha-beta hydrolase superfamily lysophospholipase